MILFYVVIGLIAAVVLAKIVSDARIAAEVREEEKYQAEHQSFGGTSD